MTGTKRGAAKQPPVEQQLAELDGRVENLRVRHRTALLDEQATRDAITQALAEQDRIIGAAAVSGTTPDIEAAQAMVDEAKRRHHAAAVGRTAIEQAIRTAKRDADTYIAAHGAEYQRAS
jgi:NifU-like protein involved in Fe-S cluster formation